MIDPLMMFAARCRLRSVTATECAEIWPRLFPGETLDPDTTIDEIVDRVAERLALLRL